MIREGVLAPAQSAKFIAENAKYVKIHEDGIEKLCNEILCHVTANSLQIPETGADDIHPNREHLRAADWVFVIDALNFCFWSRSKAEQWHVDGHTGYYALEAALHRAIRDGYDITNPEYYSKITSEDLKKILQGSTDAEIPLFDQRISVLHEVGSILLDKYNGTFETCLKEANKSAMKLLKIVVTNFPCFQDESYYKGQKVSFYKRAQILVADLWNFFGGEGWGEFEDIDEITMFADYRVPQVLLYFGALSYTDELMQRLRNDVLLNSGSEEEVEIRGCSIHAVEMLKKCIQERARREKTDIEVPNSSLIDYFLWCYRRKHSTEMEKVPYHKTFGIFY